MLYDSPDKNILSLLQNMGTLEREQLIRFFSDVTERGRIEEYLDILEHSGVVAFDSRTQRYSCRSSGRLDGSSLDKLTAAFWIPAACGSGIVRQVYLLDYPRQLLFITCENIAYDVTVCSSVNEAIISRHAISLSGIKETKDPVNHIALVLNGDLGPELGRYGFDIFCTLDPGSKLPVYGMCRSPDKKVTFSGLKSCEGDINQFDQVVP